MPKSAADNPSEVIPSPGRIGFPEKTDAGGGEFPVGYQSDRDFPPEPVIPLIAERLDRIEAKLDSILEVFGGLEQMLDKIKSDGMAGVLKMMRGK
jgi:hypothetical protein